MEYTKKIVVLSFVTLKALIDLFQWRIQDFPQGGAPTPKSAIIFQFFPENCMKMKEFGPRGGGGGARPWRPPLDPPMFSFESCCAH